MNSFYMTLLSDNSMTLFPKNTQACFQTKLPKPIDIQKGEWEMALVEIILPGQIFNVSEEERHFDLDSDDSQLLSYLWTEVPPVCDGQKLTYPLCIPAGVYSTPFHLVEEINEVIQKTIGDHLKKKHLDLEMKYSRSTKRIKMVSSKTIGLKFHPTMAAKLGVSDINKDTIVTDQKLFQHDVDLFAGINYMFIYSDVADYTLLGDIQAPILRVVPFEDCKQFYRHKEFLNLHYVPVNKSYFDEISINIRGDTGQLIQFSGGKSMVKLHFRKRPISI